MTNTPATKIVLGEELGTDDHQNLAAAVQSLADAAHTFMVSGDNARYEKALNLADSLMRCMDADLYEEPVAPEAPAA